MIEIAPRVFLVERREEAERAVANEIAGLVQEKPELVLGLATGATPRGVYRELVGLVRRGEVDLSRVTTFNLDEYLGLESGDLRSFRSEMERRFFGPAGLDPRRTHLPRCDMSPREAEAEARRYEEAIVAAGGLDLQLVGIGRNGHIGFNEPGSTRESRTRVVELAAETREDAAAAFGDLEHVPERAITIGVATILDARRLRVLAFGRSKAAIVRRALHEPISNALPATFVREHQDLEVWLDREAHA
jgi:glucosamine-6-phosphate deaminase